MGAAPTPPRSLPPATLLGPAPPSAAFSTVPVKDALPVKGVEGQEEEEEEEEVEEEEEPSSSGKN